MYVTFVVIKKSNFNQTNKEKHDTNITLILLTELI